MSLGDHVTRARRLAGSALRAAEVRDTWNDDERLDKIEVALRENAEHNRRLDEVLAGLERSLVPLLERAADRRSNR